jgi:FtsP/CotA-like multicopper oxidase with cupredoxin domain
MSSVLRRTIDRRALLIGGVGFTTAALLPHVARTARDSLKELSLTAAPGRAPLVGASYPSTDVWCYGNSIPGPEVRVRQGQPVRIVVRNELPEDTTVHWHGIRLSNAMDGVPGLTQPPIKPGEQFTTSSHRRTRERSGITHTPTACSNSDAAWPAR